MKEYRILFSICLVSYKPGKQQVGIHKYSDLFLLSHGPKVRDADNAVQLLSEDFFQFVTAIKFVRASIYNKDLDWEPKFKYLECSSFSFCHDYISHFTNSLAVLSSLRMSGAWN